MLLDISRKFRKNTDFWEKVHLPMAKNFEIYQPRCRDPPPNNPGYMAIDGGAAPWFGGSYLGL